MDWSAKSTDCVFISYSDTENLYEVWDIEKASVIRKRDVIFWENQLGHPAFATVALPHVVSIASGSGTTGKMVPHLRDDINPPPSNTSIDIPLAPLPTKQSIPKLPPEPTVAQQSAAGELTFIPYILPTAKCMIVDDGTTTDIFVEDYPYLHAFFAQHSPEMQDHLDTMFTVTMDRSLPTSYQEAYRHPNATDWRAAMERELQSLQDKHTWDLVDLPKGRRTFPNKWVFSYIDGPKAAASNGNGSIMVKARLVALGDLQQAGIDYKETFAPVVKFVSLRILLTYAALRQFATRHYDITSAFLHSDIDLEISMKQLQGFGDGSKRVYRLRKAIYGLCQAA